MSADRDEVPHPGLTRHVPDRVYAVPAVPPHPGKGLEVPILVRILLRGAAGERSRQTRAVDDPTGFWTSMSASPTAAGQLVTGLPDVRRSRRWVPTWGARRRKASARHTAAWRMTGELADRLRGSLEPTGVSRQKMFGNLAFLIQRQYGRRREQ